jgi:hypothetical protein
MNINIELDRLKINLQGISAQIIEDAVEGLDTELHRRLGRRKFGLGLSNLDVGELSLTPLHLNSTLDVAGLRGLIADRLLDALESGGGEV